MDLEKRLLQLENDRAIRDLKARYLRACDNKDTEAVAATLRPDVKIAFDGFPPIANRDEFIKIYSEFGCAPAFSISTTQPTVSLPSPTRRAQKVSGR